MKILFITNIPSPYRVDFFNELGKSCHLTVAFERMAAKDRNRNWKSDEFCNFEAIFLRGIEIGTDASISYQIVPIIRRGYDIVILNGYASPTYAIAMEYMKMNSIPFLLNADGGFIKKDKQGVYRLKRHLIGMPAAWLSTGRMTDDYLVHYGADRQNIYRYPFTSVKEQERYLPSEYEKAEKKRELCIEEDRMVLTVGQFIYRKGLDLLIKCSAGLKAGTGVYIIGGEPTEEYRKLVRTEKAENVHFLGFKSRSELREYYVAADVFVFPTREDIWGLVLNEAMARGLPCVASKHAIAANEMIEDGENGYLIEPEDLDEMVLRLNNLLEHDGIRMDMANKAYMSSRAYTIENMAHRHMELLSELNRD